MKEMRADGFTKSLDWADFTRFRAEVLNLSD
jgi:hypothetical protein